MHELSVCQGLISQVVRIAEENGATLVERIVVRIGPLSGLEAPLLEQAYTVARAGTLAEGAELVVESMPLRVACQTCGAESEAEVNRLVCGACGDYRTRVVSGDELILASVEIVKEAMH
jgi:hydrogenase nickel incorporation protein HypA/HybF